MPEYTPLDLGTGVTSAKQSKLANTTEVKAEKLAPTMLPSSLAEYAADKPNITLAEIAEYEQGYAVQQAQLQEQEQARIGNFLIEDTNNVMGNLANIGVQAGAGVARVVAQIAASVPEISAIAAQKTISEEERTLYSTAEKKKARLAGDTLTDAERAVYEPQVNTIQTRKQQGTFGDQFITETQESTNTPQSVFSTANPDFDASEPAFVPEQQTTQLATDTSAADKLSAIDDVQKYITDPKEKFVKFIRSHVNTNKEDDLIADLGEDYDKATANFEAGNYADGALDLVAGGVGSILSNPSATVGFLAESLPQMLATTIRTPANIAYAIDTATKGIAKFTEDNGRAPTRNEINQIMAVSASAAAAEQVGAIGALAKAKKVAKVAAPLKAAKNPVVSKSVTAPVKKIATATAGEAATEGFQTAAEQVAGTLDVSKVEGKEVFTSAAIGGGIGKGISTATEVVPAVKTLAQTATTKAAKAYVAGQAKVAKSKEVKAAKSVDDLKTPEAKAEFLLTPDNTPEDVAGRQKQVADIQEQIDAGMEAVSKLTDEKEINAAFDKLDALAEQQEGLANISVETPAQTATVVEAITEATEKTAESDGSVQRIFNSMATSPGRVTPAQALEVANSDVVTPKQKVQLEQYAATEEAKSVLEVDNDILVGGKGFLGIKQYQASINAANTRGDKAAATKAIAGLTKFATGHIAKAAAFTKAYDAVIAGDSAADALVIGVQAEYGIEIHKNSNLAKNPLITNVQNEAAALTAAVTQATGTEFVADTNTITAQSIEAPQSIPQKGKKVSSESTPEVVEDSSVGIARIAQYVDAIEAKGGIELTESFTSKVAKLTSQSAPKNVQFMLNLAQKIADQNAVKVVDRTEVITETEVTEEVVTDLETSQEVITDENIVEQVVNEEGTAEVETSSTVNNELHNNTLRSHKLGLRPKYNTAANVVAKGINGTLAANFTGKVNTANLLHQVENFFTDYANDKRVAGQLTPAQSKGMDVIAKYNGTFTASVLELFAPITGKRTDKKTGVEFNNVDLFNDSFQSLAAEDGSFDGNLLSTMAVVTANWLTSEAYNNVYNSVQDINKILGKPSDTPLLDGAMATLQKVGSVRNVIEESLGKEILAATGIRANKNAPGQLQGNLALSLGQMAVAVMLDQGFLKEHTVPSARIAVFAGDTKPATDARVYTSFLRVDTQVNGNEREIPSKQIDDLVNSIRDSENVLDTAFGVASKETGPVFEVPTSVVQNIKGNFQKVSKSVQKIIKAHQERPHAIKRDVSNVFGFLPEDMQLDMLGYKSDVENTVHKYHHAGTVGLNNEIVRSVENNTNFQSKLLAQGSLDTKFYMMHEVWKNQRLGMISNTINLQGDKLHRHLYGMDVWTTTVDPIAQPELLIQAKLAVAEGLGISVDKLTVDASLAQYEALIKTPEIKLAMKAIKAVNGKRAVNEDKIDQYQDAILAAVKMGGEKAFTLDALVNLVKISNTESFDFNLFREVDGITNGVAIGTWQLGAADDVADMNVRLTRTGLYNEENAATHGERAMNPNNKDSYNDLSAEWETHMDLERAGSNNAQLAALDILIFGADKATAITRAMSKNPLMITNYGAAIKGVVDAFAEDIVGNIYTKLASADAVTLKQLQAQIETVSGKKFVIKPGEQLNTLMSPDADLAIRQYIAQTYGQALENALEAKYHAFSTNRTSVNTAMTVMFEAFNIRYKRELALGESKLGHAMSADSKAELVQTLMDSVPVFNNYFSKLSGNANEKTLAMKSKKVRQYENKDYIQEQRYSRPINGTSNPNKNGANTKSTTGYSSIDEWQDAGVAPMILAIHGIDAATMVLQLENNSGLNVHDAYAFSIDEAVSGTQNFNEGFHKVMSELTVAEEVLNEVTKAIRILVDEDKADGTDNIKQLNQILTGKKMGTVSEYLATATTELKDIIATKNETTDSIKVVSQYHTEGGAFNVPTESAETSIDDDVANISEDIRGSSSQGVDTNNFNEQFSDDVNKENSVQVFDAMVNMGNITASIAHQGALKETLTNMVNKVLRPMSVKLRDVQQGETRGVVQGQSIYIESAVGGVNNQVQMSVQEVYVHELVHSVTAAGIDGTSWAARELNKLFLKARKELTFEAFLTPGETRTSETDAAAQARYDHIFNNKDVYVTGGKSGLTDTTAKRSGHLHEFMAIGLTNENFMNALGKLESNKPERFKVPTTWKMLEELFTRILDFFTAQITQTGRMAADAKLRALGEQLAGINHRKQSAIYTMYDKAADTLDDASKLLVKKVIAPLQKLTTAPIVKNSKKKVVGQLGRIGRASTKFTFEQWQNALLLARGNARSVRDGFFAQLITEGKGRTASNGYMHTLGRHANKVIDQARRETQVAVSKHLLSTFKSELTSDDKNAITRALLKTDIVSITGEYGMDEIADLLVDDAKLTAQIDIVTKKLTGANKHFYMKQARNLGLIMATGTSREHLTLRNAGTIAFYDKANQDAQNGDNVDVIDTLATLYAMSYTLGSEKALASAVIKNEYAADTKDNGIIFTMQEHAFTKEDAAKNNFAGNEALIVKGHTKEILDPNVTLQSVNEEDVADLLQAGWKVVAKHKLDPTQDRNPQVLMVNKDGLTARYDSGVASLTSLSAQGTDLIAQNVSRLGENSITQATADARADHGIIEARKGRVIAQMFKAGDTRVDEGTNMLVEIHDNQGNLTGFRYMMNEQTKINLMSKDDSFDQVLGHMVASVQDKVKSAELNAQVVSSLHEDYLGNFAKTPALFTKVGPTSTDESLKEIYAMMPHEMRESIKSTWGGKDMYVRRDMITLVFGQRKLSVSSLKKVDVEQEQGLKKIEGLFNNALVAMFANPKAKFIEDVWKEVVVAVKDAIVIKSIVVTQGNIGSNVVLLKTLGVPMKNIVRDHAIAIRSTKDFLKDKSALFEAERDLERGRGNKKELEFKIAQLNTSIANNPVKFLMDEGIYTAIVEDLGDTDKQFTKAGKLDKAIAPLKSSKAAKPLVKAAEVVLLTHETKAYKFLRDAAQLSDFVARFTLHQNNIAKGMTPKQSVDMIVDIFINYDLPTHKVIQYLNDIGFVMFTKFFIRTQKVILHIMKEHPGNTLANVLLQGQFGDVSDIMDSNLLQANLYGKTNFNLPSLVPSIVDLPTLNLVR